MRTRARMPAAACAQVESGAGALSEFSDAMYEAAGAQIVPADEAWRCAVVTHIRPPTPEEAAKVGDRTLCSMIWPAQVNPPLPRVPLGSIGCIHASRR